MAKVYEVKLDGLRGGLVVIEGYRIVLPNRREVATNVRMFVESWDETAEIALSLNEACDIRDALVAAIDVLKGDCDGLGNTL